VGPKKKGMAGSRNERFSEDVQGMVGSRQTG